MPQTLQILDGLAIVFILFLLNRLAQSRKKLSLPPGPRKLPFFGNAFDWPTAQAYKTYTTWGKRYGPLTFIKLVNRPIIVVNTAEAAFDLLERRGQIYSDRPIRPLLEWAGSMTSVVNQPYGPKVQQIRRMIRSVVGKAGIKQHEAPLAAEVHRFLRRMLNDCSNVVGNIQLSSGSTILDLDYGYDVLGSDDQLFCLLVKGVRSTLQVVVERATLPEFFPSFRMPSFIPGADFYKATANIRECLREVDTKPFAYTKEQLAAGTARSSFVAEQLNDPQLNSQKEDLIRSASRSIFFAGHETTASSLYNVVLAMMLYPEVQARAQAEIDSVIGAERLPTLQDRDQLPYVVAVVKEALRWLPPAPEGVPHRVCEDDEYMGYRIPKGSSIIVNIRGICHDPAEYANPHIFDPTRFLGEKRERDPADLVFGFGRRICPGQPFAEASIFLHVSAVLSVFNMSQDKGSVPFGRQDISQLPTYPSPLPCRFTLRSETARPFIDSVLFRGE